MKSEILTLLRNSEGYVSGQELCNRFGVSRTAIWKVINQLKKEGYVIDSVQNKGYHLVSSPDVMDEKELQSQMTTKWAGKELHYFDTTGSTNTDAKGYAEKGCSHGCLVVADTQTSGKGRRGRSWQSQKGTTIAMSLVCRPDFAPNKASMLTLVMGLAVAKAVEKVTGLTAGIKWPNDIVVNKKKICGILTEMSAELDYIQYLVIGVGINVNNGYGASEEEKDQIFPEEIREMASSLYLESGEKVSRAQIIKYAMEYFEKYYESFLETLDLTGILEDYNAHLVNKDNQVKVLDPKGNYEGLSQGIDKEGDLLVVKADGSVEKVYAGEVSVRGLYGYV